MQDQGVVAEPRRIVDVRRAGDRGEDHQVACADEGFGRVVHGHLPGRPGPLQIAAEPGGALGGQVVHARLLELPAGGREMGVDVAGDQPGADEPDPGRPDPARAELPGRQRRRRRGARGADDRALQTGERVAGLRVVENQHRRGARQPGPDVLREAGDPLQAVHPERSAQGGGQCDDPGRRAVREPQEVRRRVHRVTRAVQPVHGLDEVRDLRFPAVQGLLDLGAGDQREGRGAEGAHTPLTSPSARSTGSPSAASTSRGPSKGSRLCAVRMLSTSRRSPSCQGSRTVWAS